MIKRQERRTAREQNDEDRSAMQAELAAWRQSAETVAAQRDQLLATLAHDLRGPLNSIYGWVQLMQGGRLDGAQQARALAAVARAAQSQARLIDNIVDLASALRGALRLERERIELGALLHATLAARNRAPDVEAALGEVPVWVTGDRRHLQQMFDALIDEAVRHQPRERRMMLRLRQREGGAEVEIGTAPTPAALAPGAMSPASRGSAALLLAREIAVLHGATLEEAGQAQGSGTAAAGFRVILPVVAAPTDVQPATTAGVHSAGSSDRFEAPRRAPEPLDHLPSARA